MRYTEFMCDKCGKEMEYKDNEWARYNFRHEEEIVDIYECPLCGDTYNYRGNYDKSLDFRSGPEDDFVPRADE